MSLHGWVTALLPSMAPFVRKSEKKVMCVFINRQLNCYPTCCLAPELLFANDRTNEGSSAYTVHVLKFGLKIHNYGLIN